MKKRIFSILLSMVLTLIPLSSFAEAENTVIDGEILNVGFEKNAEVVVTLDETDENGVKYAIVDAEKWFGGLVGYNNLFDGGFGGYPSNNLPSDGVLSFKKVFKTAENTYASDAQSLYPMAFDVDGYTTGSLDSRILVKNLTTASGESTTSVSADLKQTSTSSVRIAANFRGDAGLNIKVSYTDGTSEENTVFGSRWGTMVQKETNVDRYFISENNQEGKTAYLLGSYTPGYQLVFPASFASAPVKIENSVSALGNQTTTILLFEMKTNPAKIAESITVSENNGVPVVLHSIAQCETKNELLLEGIKEAENIAAGEFSKDELNKITLANFYADILEERNYEYDFSKVRALDFYAENQKSFVDFYNIDFTDKYNADTVVEANGDIINPDTWFGGLEVNYGQYGGIGKNSFVSDGKIVFEERLWNTSTNSVEKTEETISMNYTEKNGLDSVVISKKGLLSFEKELNKIPTTSMLFALRYEVSGSPVVTVKYSDGSTQSETLQGSRYAQAIYNTPSDTQNFSAQKSEDGAVNWNFDNWRLYGLKATGNATYQLSTDEATGVSTAQYKSDETIGIHLYEVKLDETKIPVSVRVALDNSYHAAVYSMAQKHLSVDEMKSAILTNENLTFKDEAFSKKALMALNYKNLLVNSGIIEKTDYPFVDKFLIQLESEKNNYIDLSDIVDTDLMLLPNGEAPINGRTVPEAQKNTDHNYNVYYDASQLPDDGLVVMKAPSNSKFTNVYNKEAGNCYKLSGNYSGAGNDAVKVAPKSSKTIDLSKKVLLDGQRKNLSVILDTVYAGETRNPASDENTSETNMGGYFDAKVILTYDDGTEETCYIKAYLATGYYHPAVYSNAGTYGRLYEKDGKLVASSNNSCKLFGSNIKYNSDKKLSAITFVNTTSNEYHILAITETAYTNSELYNAQNTLLDSADKDTPITFTNADTLVSEAKIALEANRRGVKNITDEDVQRISEVLNNAFSFNASVANKLFSKTEFDAVNKKAVLTLANKTSTAYYYSLIVAVYEGDKLVETKFSPYKILASDKGDITETVLFDTDLDSQKQTYKLFIWDAIDGLKPLSTNKYPY